MHQINNNKGNFFMAIDNVWKCAGDKNAFFRKLEEAIRESGNPTQKPAPDMERQVHNRYQLHLVRNMGYNLQ